MQKYVLSLILFLFPATIFSQGLSFSVVFDPQLAWMNSDSKRIERSGMDLRLGGGLVMDSYFAENYAFSTGLFILGTGGDLRFLDSLDFRFGGIPDTLSPGSVLKYRLRYVTLPLSLKLKSNEIGYIRFYAHLGLNNHFRVKASGDLVSGDVKGEDIKDEVSFYNLSWFVGGGMEYSLGGNTALITGIYFTSGIWDIAKSEVYSAQSGSVSLRLGVKF